MKQATKTSGRVAAVVTMRTTQYSSLMNDPAKLMEPDRAFQMDDVLLFDPPIYSFLPSVSASSPVLNHSALRSSFMRRGRRP